TKTLHASANKPAQSDPLGHLHEERCLLKNKLPGLLKDALKDTLPQLIKDSIKNSILESIAEELPQVEAQVQKKVQDQLLNILLKPMYKEFNAFNKLKSHRFDNLLEQLSKGIKTSLDKSISLKDLKLMFKDMFSLLEAAEVFKKANAEGDKWEKNNPEAAHPNQSKGEQDSGVTTAAIALGEQSSAQVIPNAEQAPLVNKEKAMALHT
ncbi:hypothetical protein Tco_1479419, partial [Tanacetum coccineum]